MSATGERRDGGATLLEMLVVVAVMSLIAGLIFPSWISPLQRLRLASEGSKLSSALQLARARAISQGAPSSVILSDTGRSYVGTRGRIVLAPGVWLRGTPKTLSFFADGSSSGGLINLNDGRRRLSFAISEPTGLMTMTEGPSRSDDNAAGQLSP